MNGSDCDSAFDSTVEIAMQLGEAMGRLIQHCNQPAWLSLQLSSPQLKALHILATSGPRSPSALAEILKVSPATVTGLCDGLVEKSLALRETSPGDRRSNRVVATPQGERLIANLATAQREQWVRMLQQTTKDERKLIAEAFLVLLRTAENRACPEDRK